VAQPDIHTERREKFASSQREWVRKRTQEGNCQPNNNDNKTSRKNHAIRKSVLRRPFKHCARVGRTQVADQASSSCRPEYRLAFACIQCGAGYAASGLQDNVTKSILS